MWPRMAFMPYSTAVGRTKAVTGTLAVQRVLNAIEAGCARCAQSNASGGIATGAASANSDSIISDRETESS